MHTNERQIIVVLAADVSRGADRHTFTLGAGVIKR
jgi:hypothetical protein